ncbi:MAG: radical SAM protein [Faecousia sp.]
MIMLNGKCNLHCPYCFAAESMESAAGEISLEAFSQAVDFALNGTKKRGIGIIGGEPTLHSRFDNLITQLVVDSRVESVDIFTNGTTLIEHLSVFTNEKVHVLVNCNSPQMIGETVLQRITAGVDALFSSGVTMDRVGLGINIFRENDDYSYFLSLVDRYQMDSVRISVSVPPNAPCSGDDRFRYFKQHFQQAHDLVLSLLDRGTVPVFDCNKIPPCLLQGESETILQRYQNNPKSMNAVVRSNYLNGLARCTPSIVVDQNLDAIRCFALSSQTRSSIKDFTTLEELQRFYEKNIDRIGYESDHPDCLDCMYRTEKRCMGGCLVFKAELLI